ncbi:MFS transporter [Desulforudis sp. DRI-14]|uniref:MFS transporter n=1 Tax=Desulforudis sp. DRI-14 TaxID=3459793 RepID=UPI004040F2D9
MVIELVKIMHRIVYLLCLGHLVVDLNNGALPVLLSVLQEAFRLSYTAVGSAVLIANLSSSIIQPVFGLLSDRFSFRWLIPVGAIAASGGLALAGLAPSYAVVLVGVFLSGLGIAAFHPEGSRVTFHASGARKGAAAAIFSIGGNIGFGLGPMLAAALIAWQGRGGMVGLLVPAAIMGGALWLAMPAMQRATAADEASFKKAATTDGRSGGNWPAMALLTALVTLRSWTHFGVMTFLPLYYKNHLQLGTDSGATLLAVFLLSGAVGTLVGGPLADKWGRRNLMILSFSLVMPALLALPYVSGVWSLLATAVAGFMIVATFSVSVVFAQELLPRNVGLASGLVMGFAIGMGGVGTVLLGYVADHLGLLRALNVVGLLPLLMLGMTLCLPRRPEGSQTRGQTALAS